MHGVSAIAPESHDGTVQPLCAIYDGAMCRPAIERALANGELGLRRFLKSVDAETVLFDEIGNLPGSERFFVNVNTPEDLNAAVKMIGEHPSGK
jgi:molybdopterin-guanine dinucleotide biosynthesis protein A